MRKSDGEEDRNADGRKPQRRGRRRRRTQIGEQRKRHGRDKGGSGGCVAF